VNPTLAYADGSANPWEAYERWNDAIVEEFFDGRWKQRPVYLDLEDAALERVAHSVGVAPGSARPEFVTAIKSTLHLEPEGERVFGRHRSRVREWKRTQLGKPPPCAAILAFFSLVAEGMRSDETFRATNYYGRLCDSLGVGRNDQRLIDKVARDFREHSLELWDALNGWLVDAEGRLGLPTAAAFDYRVYIGVPISQALVREEDRNHLRDMFGAYRLTPRQSMSRADMVRLLDDWLPHSGASAGLRRLWRSSDARDQVADIACVELESWDGVVQGPDEPDMADGHLVFLAELRHHPRPRLTMGLAVRASSPLLAGKYVLAADASPAARAALEAVGGCLTLEATSDPGWGSITEGVAVSIPDALGGAVELCHGEGEQRRLSREPRGLVVLEKDEERGRFAEVPRAQLGRDNLVLAREALAREVDEALATAARRGHRKALAGELQGVPEGWTLYTDVELINLPTTTNPDLIALVPLSWTQVAFGGGLHLPGHSTWLTGFPPEVRATSLVDREVIAHLACARSLDGEAPETQELARFEGTAAVALEGDALPDGDYRIVVSEEPAGGGAPKPVAHASFRLRSPDTARVLPEDERLNLVHEFDGGGWVALATTEQDDESAAVGAIVPDEPPLPPPRRGGSPPPRLDPRAAFSLEDEGDVADQGTALLSGEVAPCLVGGAHYFLLPPAGRDPPRMVTIEGQCKRCGLERAFPTRPRRGAGRRRKPKPKDTGRPRPQVALSPEDVPPIPDDERPGLGPMFDALCYARSGSWASFGRIASQVDDAPWFALEAARTLSALAHLELEVDAQSGRPVRWSVAPPALATLPSSDKCTALLCGWRSPELIQRLREDVEALGGEMTVDLKRRIPSRVTVVLSFEDLQQVASSVSDSLNRPLAVSDRPARLFARRSPALSSVSEGLARRQAPVGVRTQYFNFERNKWDEAPDAFAPGALRLHTWPVTYAYAPEKAPPGRIAVADSRLVKWLVAADAGVDILGYDEQRRTLSCRLGAQLPGIYERAVTLCSGDAPTERVDGTVSYPAVPADVALEVWRALAPWGPR
jgi:hypothetical protein